MLKTRKQQPIMLPETVYVKMEMKTGRTKTNEIGYYLLANPTAGGFEDGDTIGTYRLVRTSQLCVVNKLVRVSDSQKRTSYA